MEAKQDQRFLCVKVSMDGAPYLGKIDLKTYKNYKDQSTALEKMFSGFNTGQMSRVTPLSDGASSAPISILENHELASIVLDYKRECGRDSVLQSHTSVHTDCNSESGETTLHCEHVLSLESGPTMVKARTMWRPKGAKAQETVVPSSI